MFNEAFISSISQAFQAFQHFVFNCDALRAFYLEHKIIIFIWIINLPKSEKAKNWQKMLFPKMKFSWQQILLLGIT